MASVNSVTLVGHLGKDAESRTFQSGDMVVNLSVATSESWLDKQSGERRERVEWHRVAVFNPYAVKAAERGLKGDMVYVEGSIRSRKYTDQSGQERTSYEIEVPRFDGVVKILHSRAGSRGTEDRDDGGPPDQSPEATTRAPTQQQPMTMGAPTKLSREKTQFGGQGSSLDDEIPF